MQANISISKTTANDNEYITVSLVTKERSTVKIRLSLEDYARLITGLTVNCDLSVKGTINSTDK